jgi:glycosyltransferase involved in cell wall biosynthesis
MRTAFHAPLKSPQDPVPSGDRLIGRMLVAALEAGGHEVVLASRLRSFDRDGNAARQQRIARIGSWIAARTLRRLQSADRRPDLWLTYHLYHKAPDLIGPVVAAGLGIPYCVVEASMSPGHAEGKWADGARRVEAALANAALVVNINPKDEAGIQSSIGPRTRIVSLAPFIDGTELRAARAGRDSHRAALAAAFDLDDTVPWLLAAGMMRPGDKESSYECLAEALALLGSRNWHLLVAGDGVARARIEARFAAVAHRIRFLGLQPPDAMARLMAASDVLVWPAINEAIGMVFIEAAMAGVPAIAADRPGIAAVVDDGSTGLLVAEADVAAFAGATARLLDDAPLRRTMGAAAARRALAEHDLKTAGAAFCRELERVVR